MRVQGAVAAGLAVVIGLTATATFANGQTAAKPTYVGSAKCKMCHMTQHKTWAASKHAAAFTALKPEEAAKKECITCHVTGLSDKAGDLTRVEDAVGCERCHGPGSLYGVKTVMDRKKFTADPAGTRKEWAAAGLVMPNEATCKSCHNEKSPNFKGFDFAKASAAIKHWKDKPAAQAPAAGAK